MKFNKSLIIISLILVFCISLGVVSAAEDSGISVNDINDVATVESSVNVNDEISSVGDGEINKSSEIYEDVKSATGTYNILTDYQIDQTLEIVNDNVIIEGNNCTIYGGYDLRAFNITGKDVTIQNLNFVDCSISKGYGGAIYSEGTLDVSGCSFWNCGAEVAGGAIYSEGTLDVIDCKFVGCSAGLVGGAIISSSLIANNCSFILCSANKGGAIAAGSTNLEVNSSVVGCSFRYCNSSKYGGAISFEVDNGSVEDCSFVGCSAKYGGAIHYWGYLDAKNCSFVGCYAENGGAIYCPDLFGGNIVGCSFVNCMAKGHDDSSGGAIFYYEDVNSTVSNCSFVNCSADCGGAIFYGNNVNGTVSNCSFIDCSAVNDGGAIYSKGTYTNVIDCSFVGCYAGNGGAIYSVGLLSIDKCSFIDCSAVNDGGAIYSEGSLEVRGCSFVNCSVVDNNDYSMGGAIYFAGSNLTVSECSFVGCIACSSGAICSIADEGPNCYVAVLGSNFTNCSTSAICSFTEENSTATSYLTVVGCSFVGCSSNGQFGGAIYARNSSVSECSFVDCNNFGSGGAIYFEENGSVTCCNFTNCISGDSGGAIGSSSSLEVNGCNFVNCSAKGEDSCCGGAIYSEGSLSVDSSNFTNSYAEECGGAIYSNSSLTVECCNFVDCVVSYDGCGGAIYGGAINVSGCSFVDCVADYYGGAIHSYCGPIILNSSSFINCYAVSSGGAISYEGNDSFMEVINCSFVDCFSYDGGAIYYDFDNNCSIKVINSSFVGCSAKNDGGAIYSKKGGIFNYNIFDSAIAPKGSAIYIQYNDEEYTLNFDYNFFDLQNNITEFPDDLIKCGSSPIYLNNWVVLNITPIEDSYFVNFTLNNGTELDKFMPDYTPTLSVDGDVSTITIQNNTFKGEYTPAYYRLRSIGGNLLAEIPYTTDLDYSFKTLNNTINNGSINITLDKDYKFCDGIDDEFINGIEIDNNVTIDGQGHIIDGVNLVRIFNIGGNVTIKNMTFVNGKSNCGGAIYSEEGYLNIIDCSFIACSADYSGAIDAFGSNSTVCNCSFVDCSANDFDSCGGAIGSSGSLSVSGCSFVNCNASGRGGAIYYEGYVINVSDCSFMNCSVIGDGFESRGGAIYCSNSNLTVSNCSFMECSADGFESCGGAICSIISEGSTCSVSVFVSDCSFVNCSADYGGAIYACDCSVMNCSFISCFAEFGGAIHVENGNTSVICSDFVNCSALIEAGAIQSCGGSLSVEGCSFVNCSAVGEDGFGAGGAIYNYDGSLNVVASNFVNCNSGWLGGAICGSANVTYSTFINCSSSEAGGAINSNEGTFNYNIFEMNTASRGSAIFMEYWGDINFNLDYNFFTFQNNITSFPLDLIIIHNSSEEDFTFAPDNWVVLNISSADGYYFVDFVLNDGSALKESMPDYDANLTINGDSEIITVSDNTFKDTNKAGDYLATSIISGNVLATATISRSDVSNCSIITWDCDYGDIAKVAVRLPKGVTGTISVNASGKIFTAEIKDGGSEGIAIVLLTGLNAGKYDLAISYSGNEGCLPFTATATVTVNKVNVIVTPTALSTTYDSGKYFQVKVVNDNGKAVSGLKLSLKVYTGSSYKTVAVTTDANGIAKYAASKLSIATHKVVINVDNSNYVVVKKSDSSIKVSKAATVVTAKKVTVKKGAKKYFTVTIKNKATKKVVKSLVLKIKVYTGKKYKTYKVKTNSKGIAKLSTRYLKKGTHKVVISTTSKYYTVKKSGKLIVVK